MVLNIFCWLRRSRCVVLVFFVVFLALSFFTLAPSDYDPDDEIPYYFRDSDVVRASEDALPKMPAINAATYRLARPNCNALEDGDEREIRLVEDMMYKESRLGIPNSYFHASTINCSKFRELRNYAYKPYSRHELETSLAYVIAVKSSAEQVERLLRAIYAPQNVYCLYSLSPTSIDFKTSGLGQAVQRIAGCFSNVFVTSKYIQDREEGEVAPYRVCLESLLVYPSWRYVLLISEGDFPLKTNREIIDGVQHAVYSWRSRSTSRKLKILPPLNADNDFSGFVLSRKMAIFAIRRLAKEEASKTNAFKMSASQSGNPPAILELKIRLDNMCPDGKQCALTSSDLQWLVNQPFLFARRFDLTADYVVIGCLEDRLQVHNSKINQGTIQ